MCVFPPNTLFFWFDNCHLAKCVIVIVIDLATTVTSYNHFVYRVLVLILRDLLPHKERFTFKNPCVLMIVGYFFFSLCLLCIFVVVFIHELTSYGYNVLQLGAHTHKMDFYQKHNGIWYGIRCGNLANIERISSCFFSNKKKNISCLDVVFGADGGCGSGFYISIVIHIHVECQRII